MAIIEYTYIHTYVVASLPRREPGGLLQNLGDGRSAPPSQQRFRLSDAETSTTLANNIPLPPWHALADLSPIGERSSVALLLRRLSPD